MPPWLTLLGAVSIFVLAVAFIFFVARGCVATQEATQVRKYVTGADSILSESANLGNERLQGILQDANGDPAKLDEEALVRVVEDSELLYRRTLANEDIPPEFDDAHHYLLSSLGIRAEATERLEDAATGDAGSFEEALSETVEDYKASDSLVSGPYLSASTAALDEAGQGRDRTYLYEPRPFMDYEELGYEAASELPAQSDPNTLHGVELTAVEVAGQPLYPGGNVTLAGPDTPTFSVAVTNGGEAPQTGVPVEVVVDTVERQSRTATIEKIQSQDSATVEVAGFRPGELNETARVSVKAGPVEYEEYLKNNTIEGAVTFGL